MYPNIYLPKTVNSLSSYSRNTGGSASQREGGVRVAERGHGEQAVSAGSPEPPAEWKLCVRVCVHVCMFVRARVFVCTCMRVCARVCGGLFACTCGGQGWGHPRVHELLGGGQWLPVGLGFSGQSPEKFLATAGTGDGGSKPATGQQHGRIPVEPCGPRGGTQLVATVRNDEQVASMPKEETENRSQRGHVRSRAEAPPEDRVRRTTSSVHVCGGEGRPTRGRPRTRRAACCSDAAT